MIVSNFPEASMTLDPERARPLWRRTCVMTKSRGWRYGTTVQNRRLACKVLGVSCPKIDPTGEFRTRA